MISNVTSEDIEKRIDFKNKSISKKKKILLKKKKIQLIINLGFVFTFIVFTCIYFMNLNSQIKTKEKENNTKLNELNLLKDQILLVNRNILDINKENEKLTNDLNNVMNLYTKNGKEENELLDKINNLEIKNKETYNYYKAIKNQNGALEEKYRNQRQKNEEKPHRAFMDIFRNGFF